MTKKKVNIIGCGGHSRSVIDLLVDQNYEVGKYFDDDGKLDEVILGFVKYGGKVQNIPNSMPVVLAIGDNRKRKFLYKSLTVLKSTVTHSTSRIGSNSKVSKSTLIFSNVNICTEAMIGENCIINTNSLIEHESRIGNHCHISVGAIIAGRVVIGDECFIGAGAIVKDKINICSNVIIGAGSVVVNNIEKPGIYVGIPAKKIKEI